MGILSDSSFHIVIMDTPCAERLISTWDSHEHLAIITISSRNEQGLHVRESASISPVLPLAFDNVEIPSAGLVPMSLGQATEVAEFIRDVPSGTKTLLVHCDDDTDRPAGIAAAISESRRLGDDKFLQLPFSPNMCCYKLTFSALFDMSRAELRN